MSADPAPRAGRLAAESGEPRALRSRRLLVEALLDLLAERPLAELTVVELCRRAGVNRATFYGHWADQRALAAEVFAELVDDLAEVPASELGDLDDPGAAGRYHDSLRGQLGYVAAHRTTFRALFGSDADAGFRRALTAALERRAELAVRVWVQRGVAPADTPAEFATHLAGGLVAVLARWAASEDEDVAGAARRVAQLLPPWWPRPGTA
ncbi:TetR/AcrR family transcriptional regulator [Kineococcus sp. SYSU DK002]|uniref:TetR/AcrR family transcriptional regulator n=1 Tax=Kineococcus sp. SYSU DK002 TaxID=3383123 RepID=UPI003D7E2185